MPDQIPPVHPSPPDATPPDLSGHDAAWLAASAAAEKTRAAVADPGAAGIAPPSVITYSYLRTLGNCKRMAYLGYELRLEPLAERDEALRFGTIWHAAMEARDLAIVAPGPDSTPMLTDEAVMAATRAPILAATPLADRAIVDPSPAAHAQRAMRLRLLAMTAAYEKKWGVRDVEFRAHAIETMGAPGRPDDPRCATMRPCVELQISGPIVNPETGAKSRTFTFAGKVDEVVDLLVEIDQATGMPQLWLVERKTATTIDGGYLARLVLDAQLRIYVHYLRVHMGLPVVGAIYDVAGKPGLKLGEGETEVEHAERIHAKEAEIRTAMAEAGSDKGETEAEFEARRAALAAASKTGRSSAKRKMPETPDEFSARVEKKVASWLASDAAQRKMPEPDADHIARLAEWFEARDLEPGKERFHRERVVFTDDSIDEVRDDVWDLAQQVIGARRRGKWSKNETQCFVYNRECRFWPICSAGRAGAEMVTANLYRIRPEDETHPELQPGGSDDISPKPF